MRPVLHRAVLAAACLSALVLSGCGKQVAPDAPITFAPADTPYVFANFKGRPADIAAAWAPGHDSAVAMDIRQLGTLATLIGDRDSTVARVLEAMQIELAKVRSTSELEQTLGFSQSALAAIYGIGDVPVARVELASPNAFKAFWARVEKQAGVSIPTATLGNQGYWVLGGDAAQIRMLVAVEGKQLVATLAPAKASPALLKQLLGLSKPTSNAAGRLEKINSTHGYGDYGSGYVDLPKLFANLYDGKDAVTQAFARDLGDASLTDPSCASEFASLANQVPLASMGMQTYSAKTMRSSFDLQLSPTLLGALTALKQPVPGMAGTSGDSVFDIVLALPLEKWRTFIEGREQAAAAKPYQCPALQSLNAFAHTAANPPVQMPPEAASLLGFRMMLDKWDSGPQIAGRMLVANSNPGQWAETIQQSMPQFALKSISSDGRPVAFDLPPKLQAMLGGGNQGWIAANANALAVGIGDGEDAKLADALQAPAGHGDLLMRMHLDGKLYGILASWIGRFAAMEPAEDQARAQQMATLLRQMGTITASVDMDAKLDDQGLHVEREVRHR